MYPTEQEIQALNISQEQLTLFTTPFKDLTKEGSSAALNLGDKVANYRFEEARKQREAEEKAMSEEAKIHHNKENMIKLKRNFY